MAENGKPYDFYLDRCYNSESPEFTVSVYDQWSANYEHDNQLARYKGPEYLVQIILQYVGDKHARILDIAAGTGLVGKLLREQGYKNIDAHDGSSQMLKEAQKSDSYTNCMHELLIEGRKSQVIEPKSYDLVTAVGAFCPGGLTADNLHIFDDAAKKSGLIIFGLNESFESDTWLHKLEQITGEKRWKLLSRQTFEEFRFDKNGSSTRGVYYVFRANT